MPILPRPMSDDELSKMQQNIIQSARETRGSLFTSDTTIPEPGEIAETIIADFYEEWSKKEEDSIDKATERGVASQGMLDLVEEWDNRRREEMLENIWVLLLEQKARDGGFDDVEL